MHSKSVPNSGTDWIIFATNNQCHWHYFSAFNDTDFHRHRHWFWHWFSLAMTLILSHMTIKRKWYNVFPQSSNTWRSSLWEGNTCASHSYNSSTTLHCCHWSVQPWAYVDVCCPLPSSTITVLSHLVQNRQAYMSRWTHLPAVTSISHRRPHNTIDSDIHPTQPLGMIVVHAARCITNESPFALSIVGGFMLVSAHCGYNQITRWAEI